MPTGLKGAIPILQFAQIPALAIASPANSSKCWVCNPNFLKVLIHCNLQYEQTENNCYNVTLFFSRSWYVGCSKSGYKLPLQQFI